MNLNFDISPEGLTELIESYYNPRMAYYRKSTCTKGKRYMGHRPQRSKHGTSRCPLFMESQTALIIVGKEV